MRIVVAVLFLFGAGLVGPSTGHGQLRTPAWHTSQAREVHLPSESLVSSALPSERAISPVLQSAPSYERVALGTAIGAVVGAAAGVGVVAMTRGQPADAVMFPWADLVGGAVLGSVPGMYLGARLSSGREGNPWLTGTAAAGGTALGLLAGIAVGSLLAEGDTGKAPEVMGIALAVAVPVGLTSFVEWRAAR